jgi:hypothetical protein
VQLRLKPQPLPGASNCQPAGPAANRQQGPHLSFVMRSTYGCSQAYSLMALMPVRGGRGTGDGRAAGELVAANWTTLSHCPSMLPSDRL